jgi:hypothetical protein
MPLSYHRMKVVLQNKNTGGFLAAGKCWVPRITEALSFRNMEEALERCRKERLSEVQLFIQTIGGRDLIVPVPEPNGRSFRRLFSFFRNENRLT